MCTKNDQFLCTQHNKTNEVLLVQRGNLLYSGGLVDKLTHMLPAETSPGGHISFDNLTDVPQNDSQEKSFLEAFCSSIGGFLFYYYNNVSLNS